MEVNNQVLPGIREAVNGSGPVSANNSDELQERFMTLLITQIKNQDPLNPLDNAEVTSQLAQLNMVGGIEKLNDRIEAMANSFAAGQTLQAANLVGRDVLVEANTLKNDGQGSRFGADLAQSVSAMTVEILSPGGQVVERIDLGPQPAGLHALEWDGLDANGQAVPAGQYGIQISAVNEDGDVAVTTLAGRTVSAVSTSNGKVEIELPDLGVVSLEQIRQFI